MAYRRVSKEEFENWVAQNPGGVARVNGVETPVGGGAKDLGFFGNLARSVTKPVRALASMPEYLVQALSAASRGETGLQPGEYKSIFLTPEEENAWARDPLREGLKSSVGLGAGLIPGGGGAATSTAGKIGTAGARGVASGALGGLGYSDPGEELEGLGTGALWGGVLGAGLQGVSEAAGALKASKASNKLDDMASDLKTTAYKKKIGKAPTAKQGKYDLVRESMKLADDFNYKVNSADDLYKFSDELFNSYGGVANQYARNFDELGGAISVQDIKKPLLDKIAKAKTPELKAPYQKVLRSIDDATMGSDVLSASDLLQLKREWGSLGNWNQLTPTKERVVAKAWEEAYRSADDVLDSALSSAGMKDFRKVNKILSTAIEQQNWARRAAASRSGQQVWTDMAQDATMFSTALGGGPGGVAGFLASKGLQRYGEDIASKGLSGAGRVVRAVEGLGSILPGLASVGQRATPAIVGATEAMPERQETQEPQQEGLGGMLSPQEQGPQIDESALINAVLSGQISRGDAEWLMEMLGLQASETSNLETAISELERLYGAGTPQSLSLGDKSTGVIGLANKGIAAGKGAFNQDFADRKAAYDQARALAVGIINQARAAGVLNEGEYQTMIENMPNEYTTERVAQDWFQNVRRMLANSGKSEETNNAAITNIMPWIAQ